MKPITLEKAFSILEHDIVCISIDGFLAYPRLLGLTGDLENEFMTISWKTTV